MHTCSVSVGPSSLSCDAVWLVFLRGHRHAGQHAPSWLHTHAALPARRFFLVINSILAFILRFKEADRKAFIISGKLGNTYLYARCIYTRCGCGQLSYPRRPCMATKAFLISGQCQLVLVRSGLTHLRRAWDYTTVKGMCARPRSGGSGALGDQSFTNQAFLISGGLPRPCFLPSP